MLHGTNKHEQEFAMWYRRYKARLDLIVDGICTSAEAHVKMPRSNTYNFYFDMNGMREDLLRHIYYTSRVDASK